MTEHVTDQRVSEFTVETVDAIERTTGRFPGYRRVHARGLCFEATFTPNGAASPLTTAAHLQRGAVLATVRFSNSNANPATPDGQRAGRGMAVRFHLPDDSYTDLVSVNLPVFFAATPESFRALLDAVGGDPMSGEHDPAKLSAHLAAHPDAAAGLREVAIMPIPVSYGTTRYWANHAFVWTGPDGHRHAVRCRWEPDLGLQELSEAEAAQRPPEYLTEDLLQRLTEAPVGFTLRAQLGEPGDRTDDPTVAWPAERTELVVGHLSVTAPVADQDYWSGQSFDPTRVTAGVDLSDDPVLAFRGQAYTVSHDRRVRGQ